MGKITTKGTGDYHDGGRMTREHDYLTSKKSASPELKLVWFFSFKEEYQLVGITQPSTSP